MTEEVELKACPFCGQEVEVFEWETVDGKQKFAQCVNNDCFMSENDGIRIKVWNTRPLEDALLKRAEEAEAIINGMFPMWISAMAYCEHGKKDDLMRMKNYYNGRDNPLTAEQIGALFEIQKTPEALKNE